MTSDNSLKVSDYVFRNLETLKERYEHKSYDSLFRQLLRDSGLQDSGEVIFASSPHGDFSPEDSNNPYWIGKRPDDDTYIGVPPRLLNHNVGVTGITGIGKTTLLEVLFSQQLSRGEGGIYAGNGAPSLVDILRTIPDERKDDVIIIGPSREGSICGFNLLGTYRNPGDPGYEKEISEIVETVSTVFQPDFWVSQDKLLRKLFNDFPHQETSLFELYKALSTIIGDTDTDISADSSNPWLPVVETLTESVSDEDIKPLIRQLRLQIEDKNIRETLHQPSPISLEEAIREQKIILVNMKHPAVNYEVCFSLIERLQHILRGMDNHERIDGENPYRIYLDDIKLPERATFNDWLSTAQHRNFSFVFSMQPSVSRSFQNQRILEYTDTLFVGHTAAIEAASRLAQALGPSIDAEDITTSPRYHYYLRSLPSDDLNEPVQIEGLNGTATLADDVRTDTEIQELIEKSIERYGTEPVNYRETRRIPAP